MKVEEFVLREEYAEKWLEYHCCKIYQAAGKLLKERKFLLGDVEFYPEDRLLTIVGQNFDIYISYTTYDLPDIQIRNEDKKLTIKELFDDSKISGFFDTPLHKKRNQANLLTYTIYSFFIRQKLLNERLVFIEKNLDIINQNYDVIVDFLT